MALVKTTIDGREVEVERDRWALDVAREVGIDIPTLCQHPAVEPYGACRLCVVEVTKGKWTWLTTSCDLPIREGLTIRTDTESVKTARKMAAELLWSSAPDSEVIAELARGLGVEKPRFANHDERGKCILCGLCVRVCQKVLGESAVCFAQRGSCAAAFDAAGRIAGNVHRLRRVRERLPDGIHPERRRRAVAAHRRDQGRAEDGPVRGLRQDARAGEADRMHAGEASRRDNGDERLPRMSAAAVRRHS